MLLKHSQLEEPGSSSHSHVDPCGCHGDFSFQGPFFPEWAALGSGYLLACYSVSGLVHLDPNSNEAHTHSPFFFYSFLCSKRLGSRAAPPDLFSLFPWQILDNAWNGRGSETQGLFNNFMENVIKRQVHFNHIL